MYEQSNTNDNAHIQNNIWDAIDYESELEGQENDNKHSFVYVDNTLQNYNGSKYIKINRE